LANLLEQDIKKSAEEQDIWSRRFRDVQMYAGSSSPFDYLLLTNKQSIGIEAKLLRGRKSGNPKSFPFSRLSDVQREGLKEFEQIGGNSKAYVMVNFRWVDNKKGQCFAFRIGEFLEIEQTIDRKSIPLDMFRELAIELPRQGKGWNLEWLM